ncbi:VanZ family protein [Parvicella tangerina]|nr:VanZ family protein [Parvicella tangerina]
MKFRSFWPAICWTLLILGLSFMPGKSFPSADWMDWFKLDKWVHAFLYAVLFTLLFIPIQERKMIGHARLVLLSVSFCLFLGLFTEIVQGVFLVDRSGDLPDMIANTLGVFLSVLFFRFKDKKWPWKVTNE